MGKRQGIEMSQCIKRVYKLDGLGKKDIIPAPREIESLAKTSALSASLFMTFGSPILPT
jgi:hypothetical protein